LTNPVFNAVDDPWIVVRNVRGDTETVGIRDLFRRAHEFRDLAGELPSQDFAVFRVLLAVLYRALDTEPWDEPEEQWAKWWNAETLPLSPIEAYLDHWRHRFELFDPVQPWFQVGGLESVSGDTRPVDLLVPDCPAAGGLFSMRRGYQSLSPAEATRWIVHCQAYDSSGIKTGAKGDPRVSGGKGYPIGTGWAGWFGGLTVVGDNLRETLLLNLVLDRPRDDSDIPIWEEPSLGAAPRTAVVVRGPLALLTWPQRRIRLFPSADGTVTSILICNGDPVPYQWLDEYELMSGWRFSEPQTKNFKKTVYMPRALDPSQALWRGLTALLPTTGSQAGKPDRFKPCQVIRWSSKLALAEALPTERRTRIKAVGIQYGPQSASWDEVFSDRLAFNVLLAIEGNSAAKETVYAAADRSNDAVRAVGQLAANLQRAAGGSPEAASETAQAQGFARIDAPFRRWLEDLSASSDTEQGLTQWTQTLREVVLELGDQLLHEAGPAAWVGRTAVVSNTERVISTGQAAAWFRSAVSKVLPQPAVPKGEPA